MDRINSLLSFRESKIPRRKFKLMSPKYTAVSSVVSSAAYSNILTTLTANPLSTNISTSAIDMTNITTLNNIHMRIRTSISDPIYTLSSSSSTPHFSGSNIGIETWARNLTTPILHSSPPINLKLPSLWEDDIELWLAAVDHQFILSNICTEQRCFSAMLGALDYQVIRKVQHIIRNPGNQPYQTLKQVLIKLYKISDDNRFDRLPHQTDLGDRIPSELLSESRTLLGESCSDNADLNKLLHKLFLDKLPPQVRLV